MVYKGGFGEEGGTEIKGLLCETVCILLTGTVKMKYWSEWKDGQEFQNCRYIAGVRCWGVSVLSRVPLYYTDCKKPCWIAETWSLLFDLDTCNSCATISGLLAERNEVHECMIEYCVREIQCGIDSAIDLLSIYACWLVCLDQPLT